MSDAAAGSAAGDAAVGCYGRLDRSVHRVCPLCNGAMVPQRGVNGVGVDSGYVRFSCVRCSHFADISRRSVGGHVIRFLEKNGGETDGV